jgi:hypothetical protein
MANAATAEQDKKKQNDSLNLQRDTGLIIFIFCFVVTVKYHGLYSFFSFLSILLTLIKFSSI